MLSHSIFLAQSEGLHVKDDEGAFCECIVHVYFPYQYLPTPDLDRELDWESQNKNVRTNLIFFA